MFSESYATHAGMMTLEEITELEKAQVDAPMTEDDVFMSDEELNAWFSYEEHGNDRYKQEYDGRY